MDSACALIARGRRLTAVSRSLGVSRAQLTNAVVLWNTIYMQEALSHLRKSGETPEDEHLARLSPLIHGHINMLGHYTFSLPDDILKGELRPINFNTDNELNS